jgi:flavin-dependent dehydrogenase
LTSDVLIIGAGPAGSAAAIEAARHGLRATLVESEPFPRERPGESLHPGVEPLLEKLGIDAVNFPRVEGTWVAWGSPLQFQPYGSDERGAWLGYHAWRADFDNLLLTRAIAAGCCVLQPARAIKPLRHCGHVLTSEGEIEARCLIDASGHRQWLARHKNLKYRLESPKLVATYSYVEGSVEGPDPLIEADAMGWTWTARVLADLTGWVRLNWSGEPPPDTWRPKRISHLCDARPLRRTDVTWRRLEAPAGPGYFCVGDAAAVLDPASSHGVLKAVMSGMMAGYLTARLLQGDRSAEEIAAEYNRWLAEWFSHDVQRLRELYGSLPNPPRWV